MRENVFQGYMHTLKWYNQAEYSVNLHSFSKSIHCTSKEQDGDQILTAGVAEGLC